MEAIDRGLRWAVAGAWLAPVVMALAGAWRGRGASGRKIGRPFAETPWWLYVPMMLGYVGLIRRLWRQIPVRLSPASRLVASLLGSGLSLIGIGLVIWGRLALADMYNVSSAFGARLYRQHRLVTSGPFAYVRHPMYLGAFVAGIGGVLLYRTWATLFMLAHSAVFVVRARKEEQALAAEFGADWEIYRWRVPAWIPRLRRWSLALPPATNVPAATPWEPDVSGEDHADGHPARKHSGAIS